MIMTSCGRLKGHISHWLLNAYNRFSAEKMLMGITYLEYLQRKNVNVIKLIDSQVKVDIRFMCNAFYSRFIGHVDRRDNLHINRWSGNISFSSRKWSRCPKGSKDFMGMIHTLKTWTSMKATHPENAMWIILSVIGNGKLNPSTESTHWKWNRHHKFKMKVFIILQVLGKRALDWSFQCRRWNSQMQMMEYLFSWET